jgi:hypothetical protein
MSYITWIVIILIFASILVTVTEVILRFVMLKKSGNKARLDDPFTSISWSGNLDPANVPEILSLPSPSLTSRPGISTTSREGISQKNAANAEARTDLEILALTLGLQSDATLDDVRRGIRDLKHAAASAEHCADDLSHMPSGELRKKAIMDAS